MRILVVRNDKLGDFMLAWPAFALLKHYWPEAHLSALVPAYTAPMAELCPWLDDIVIDQQGEGIFALRRRMADGQYDALLTLFSSGRVALAGCLSGIPYRLAPATKLAQFCYNHRLLQSRSRSEKPEYAYNLDLAYRLLHDLAGTPPTETSENKAADFLPAWIPRPLLHFDSGTRQKWRQEFCQHYNLNPHACLVFIHPGSGGSANNLSVPQYAQLLNTLRCWGEMYFVITAGPGEEQTAQMVARAVHTHRAICQNPEGGLEALTKRLAFCDLFISNSTGPLHIAGALNCNIAAFYPRHRSGSPLRWQPLNEAGNRLIFTPDNECDAMDVEGIDVIQAASKISERFLLDTSAG